jgi:hypothetical protein
VPEWLQSPFASDAGLSLADIAIKQVAAFMLGCIVAAIYAWTRRPKAGEGKSMMATLVLLAVLIGMISSVIGDNVARAFSLVGALSIVRFRTVVEDTRDTAFVIFAVGVGLAVGAGYLFVPLVLVPFATLAAMLFRDQSPLMRAEITIRTSLGVAEEPVLAALGTCATKVYTISSSTARQGAALETTYGITLSQGSTLRQLIESLSTVNGVIGVDARQRDSS